MTRGDVAIEDIYDTHIVLIPKVSTPRSITQFCSISLCNVLYKIIAKALINKMSGFLNVCVHESHGAFIPGHQISDNVLVAYEILHILKNKKWGKKGNFALKLDISKVYDWVK